MCITEAREHKFEFKKYLPEIAKRASNMSVDDQANNVKLENENKKIDTDPDSFV